MSIKQPNVDVLRLDTADVLVSDLGLRLILLDARYHCCFITSDQAVELAQEILRRYDVKAAV